MTTIAQILRGVSLYTSPEDRAKVLDQMNAYLSDKDFLVDNQFSTVDTIVYKKIWADAEMWAAGVPSCYTNVAQWFMRVQSRGITRGYQPLNLTIFGNADNRVVHQAVEVGGRDDRHVGEVTGMMGAVRLQKIGMAPCSCCHHE